MADSKYLKVYIDNQEVELEAADQLPVSISYRLEDAEDFQKKKSSEAFNIKVPATLKNQLIANNITNPSVEDFTSGTRFKGFRKALIEANGYELLVGKAKLKGGSHASCPVSYDYDMYGNNADWLIDLNETTLYEVLKDVSFVFSKATIEASWLYDGTSEALPYVFAPVKYGNWLGDETDDNVSIMNMKPSISPYWVLYKGFKLAGYKIQSEFLDSEYFRRAVMPWVWGNFLSSEGTKYEIHKFKAKSLTGNNGYYIGYGTVIPGEFADVKCTNDNTDGMFDNNNTVANGDYEYFPGNQNEMRWTYKTPHFGPLEVTLSIEVDIFMRCSNNSNADVWVNWYKNGTQIASEKLAHLQAPDLTGSSGRTFQEIVPSFFTTTVNPNDTVSARIYVRRFDSTFGQSHQTIKIFKFQTDYFRVPLGGTISFDAYNGLKKIKFLDFVRGIFDCFNMSVSTDSVNKLILMEPTHPIDESTGYFNGKFINWETKQDLSKQSEMDQYSDYEREVMFRFKNDSNDGILKLIQDRNTNVLAAGKYVFPDRFKKGKKEVENRFFSPVMHYEAEQFKDITGVAPQLVVIVPENISNTSRSEAQNTFAPKLCWYKGNISGVGGWKFDDEELTSLPYMFAVNYKTGGENDPIFSYSDEQIGSAKGMGLMKKFFWQRLAIMRNGQFYTTWLHLNNKDAASSHHREHKIIRGEKWELVEINNYRPLLEESTKCFLRKWSPVSIEDYNASYPSEDSVLTGTLSSDQYDIKYAQLKCLTNDIPKPSITTP